jgi:hypothetical protein
MASAQISCIPHLSVPLLFFLCPLHAQTFTWLQFDNSSRSEVRLSFQTAEVIETQLHVHANRYRFALSCRPSQIPTKKKKKKEKHIWLQIFKRTYISSSSSNEKKSEDVRVIQLKQ